MTVIPESFHALDPYLQKWAIKKHGDRIKARLAANIEELTELQAAVLPHMRRAGGGRIVNVAGIAARHITGPGMTAGAINAAIVNFTKSLGDQVARDGILVNAVHPGATRTHRHELIIERLMKDHGITKEEAEQRSVAAIPIGRVIEPEDVANMIVFLSSSAASAVTGQTIAVEGGASRGVFY